MEINNIYELVCGIAISNNYTYLDKWGEIADNILYNNDYFNPEYFPMINSNTSLKSLFNQDSSHLLQLSATNLIYKHKIIESFDEEYGLFKEKIIKYLIPNIVEKYDLIARRIGLVYISRLDNNCYKNIINKYFKIEPQTIINFRFSQKHSTPEGANFKNTNNFINHIITISSNNDNEFELSFDYQLHFVPNNKNVLTYCDGFFVNGFNAFKQEVGFNETKD